MIHYTSFEELNGFEDSKEYIEKSEEGIKENEKAEKYKEATELISSGEYDEALKTLKYIIGYKDTDSLKKDCVEKYSNELLADKNYEECIKICVKNMFIMVPIINLVIIVVYLYKIKSIIKMQ